MAKHWRFISECTPLKLVYSTVVMTWPKLKSKVGTRAPFCFSLLKK